MSLSKAVVSLLPLQGLPAAKGSSGRGKSQDFYSTGLQNSPQIHKSEFCAVGILGAQQGEAAAEASLWEQFLAEHSNCSVMFDLGCCSTGFLPPLPVPQHEVGGLSPSPDGQRGDFPGLGMQHPCSPHFPTEHSSPNHCCLK